MNKKYYTHNDTYSKMLSRGQIEDYEIYKDAISAVFTSGRFLDVGCGTGTVVNYFSETNHDAYGVEISVSSLKIAKKKAGKYLQYNGMLIPYTDGYFDVVGSNNVLEHVEDVSAFLNESLRVVKKGGYLIICAPNFMSMTSSHHYRTASIKAKIINLGLLISRLFTYFLRKKVIFEKMSAVDSFEFHPDDDATNLINPLDLLAWGRLNNLLLVKYVGSLMPKKYLSNKLGSIPLLNLLTGGVCIIFKKT